MTVYSGGRGTTSPTSMPQNLTYSDKSMSIFNVGEARDAAGQSLVLIPRETGINDRLTDQVVVRRITVTIQLYAGERQDNGGYDKIWSVEGTHVSYKEAIWPQQVEFALIHDKQWNSLAYQADAAVYGGLIWTSKGAGINALSQKRNLEHTHRFNVLKRKRVVLGTEQFTFTHKPTSVEHTSIHCREKTITIDCKMRIPIRYTAQSVATTETSDLVDDNIILIARTNAVGSNIRITGCEARVRFSER